MYMHHVSRDQMGEGNDARDASERCSALLLRLQGSAIVHPFAA